MRKKITEKNFLTINLQVNAAIEASKYFFDMEEAIPP